MVLRRSGRLRPDRSLIGHLGTRGDATSKSGSCLQLGRVRALGVYCEFREPPFRPSYTCRRVRLRQCGLVVDALLKRRSPSPGPMVVDTVASAWLLVGRGNQLFRFVYDDAVEFRADGEPVLGALGAAAVGREIDRTAARRGPAGVRGALRSGHRVCSA